LKKNPLSKYKHIFFDLDRTLWDFDTNSGEALTEIFNDHKLEKFFESPAQFIKLYHFHNEKLWRDYRSGKMKKEVMRSMRFELTLRDVQAEDSEVARTIGEKYVRLSMEKTILFPFALEILDYLYPKYPLYILTNGFIETQFNKMRNSGLDKYFTQVFASETIGISKPDSRIFQWAVNSVNGHKNECLMIGDDFEVDILGAKAYGIDQVFFNPMKINADKRATYEITSLIELRNIL